MWHLTLWLCSADCYTTTLVCYTRDRVRPLLHADAASLATWASIVRAAYYTSGSHRGRLTPRECVQDNHSRAEKACRQNHSQVDTLEGREITWSKLGEGVDPFLVSFCRFQKFESSPLVGDSPETGSWRKRERMGEGGAYGHNHTLHSCTWNMITHKATYWDKCCLCTRAETMEVMIRYLGNISLVMFRLFTLVMVWLITWIESLGPSSSAAAAAQKHLC